MTDLECVCHRFVSASFCDGYRAKNVIVFMEMSTSDCCFGVCEAIEHLFIENYFVKPEHMMCSNVVIS